MTSPFDQATVGHATLDWFTDGILSFQVSNPGVLWRKFRVLEAHSDQAASTFAFPPEMMDGYLVLGATLARKLDALLLPRQLLLTAPAGHRVGVLSFVHGVPQASSVAGVTQAQDKRLRRTLLNIAGLPIPPGITFSSRASKDLQRFTSRYGYPFVLKEAIGENPSSKVDKISNERELMAAISRMRRRTDDQLAPARSLVISAYAENSLDIYEDEFGNRLAPPRRRLLIEKRVSGQYIRCLICGGNVLAAIEIYRSVPTACKDIFDQLHPDFCDIARRTASVIPGLAVASVDFVVADFAQEPANQTYYIVELSERSRLDSYMQASPELGSRLADAILAYQAERSSIALSAPVHEIAIRIRAEGLSNPTELLPFFCATCNALDLAGSVATVHQLEGIIEGHIQGAPPKVALVLEGLMSGVHFGQRAKAADICQTTMGTCAEFRVT